MNSKEKATLKCVVENSYCYIDFCINYTFFETVTVTETCLRLKMNRPEIESLALCQMEHRSAVLPRRVHLRRLKPKLLSVIITLTKRKEIT